jgi:hypothetical protein
MTGFRLLCCLCLVLLISTNGIAQPPTDSASATIDQLQQENTSLQLKVKRLERQVSAMREEMNTPDATQIIGGIGYIVGIFGVCGWIAARKKSGREG